MIPRLYLQSLHTPFAGYLHNLPNSVPPPCLRKPLSNQPQNPAAEEITVTLLWYFAGKDVPLTRILAVKATSGGRQLVENGRGANSPVSLARATEVLSLGCATKSGVGQAFPSSIINIRRSFVTYKLAAVAPSMFPIAFPAPDWKQASLHRYVLHNITQTFYVG